MLALSVQNMWARRRRVARTAVAIVLGVAFLVGTLVLGDTIAANFDELFTDTAAGTDVVVRSESPLDDSFEADAGRRPVDAALVDRVSSIDGVAVAEPQISGYGQILGEDGDPIGGNGPPRLAGNWIETPALNPYRIVEGRAPDAPDEVVINRGAAEAGDLALGDRTVVQVPDPVKVEIVGIATFGEADGFGETTFAGFATEAARDLLMRDASTVSAIVVAGTEGTDPQELAARIREELPAGAEAITGAELVDERLDRLDFLGTVRVFLAAFGVIAVVVAGLSINNAFTITVAQRTRELALLRTVGANRRQLRRLVLLEALVLAAVGSILGVLVGLGVAAGLKGVFDGVGFSLPAGGLTLERSAVVVGVVVGVGSTLLAARVPARRAAQVSPMEALRTSGGAEAPVTRRRLVTGSVALAVGLALGVAGGSGSAALVGGAAVLLLVGTLLVAPVLVPWFTAAIGPGPRLLRGVDGDLAVRNVRRAPRRAASTATPLLVGVAVVTVFTVFAGSSSAAIEQDVSQGFGRADLAINTPAFGGGVLGPEVLDDLAGIDAISGALPVARGSAVLEGDEVQVTATDIEQAAGTLELVTVDGDLTEVGPREVVVTESRAKDNGWTVGSTVDLTFFDGAVVDARVGAIVEDAPVLPGVVVATDLWFAHAPQPSYATVFLTLADGVDVAAGRAAVAPVADRYSGEVQDREGFAEAATGGVDMLLRLVYVLLALAIVISLLGIANAMSMAIHERRREIGLLRAVGQTRRSARRVVRLESVLVALLGTVVGLGLGTVVGVLLFRAAFEDASPSVPLGALGAILLAGVVAGALAARRPARRAARLDVLDALGAA